MKSSYTAQTESGEADCGDIGRGREERGEEKLKELADVSEDPEREGWTVVEGGEEDESFEELEGVGDG